MNPICPNCGSEQTYACGACDDGYPDYNGGSICNDCGACVMNDDWEWDEEEAESWNYVTHGNPNTYRDEQDIIDHHRRIRSEAEQ